MLSKIKKVFRIGDTRTGQKIVINCEKLEARVALLENGVLEEYSVERADDVNIVGSIFKGSGHATSSLASRRCSSTSASRRTRSSTSGTRFPPPSTAGLEEVQRPGAPQKKRQKRITAKDIPDIYPVGSEVLIQVTKGPIGTKGPRVTTNLSLAGRYMVLLPRNEQFGISRKIDDPKERTRLRHILERAQRPRGHGRDPAHRSGRGNASGTSCGTSAVLLEQWENRLRPRATTTRRRTAPSRSPG